MDLKKTAVFFCLAWLLGLAAFVRLQGLTDYYFSPDDVYQLWISGQPTLALAWKLGSHEPHPPLLYMVLHLMLKISRNELFLRGFSFIPGMALVPAGYFLGRKVSGTASGMAMAAMAACGYGAMLMSESIRTYSIIALSITVVLYLYAAYQDDGRPSHLYLMAPVLALALLFEYVIAFFVAGMGLVWAASLLLKRKPARGYFLMAVTFLPFVMALAFLYYIHLSGVLSSVRFANPIEPWNAPYFFSDWPGFLSNMRDLFGYFFLPGNALWTSALALAGFAALGKQKRADLAAIILVTLAINIIFTLRHKYSLGGIRHSYYLFPLACLLIGASVQYVYDAVEGRLRSWRGGGVFDGMAGSASSLAVVAMLFLVSTSVAVASYYSKSNYLRRYGGKSWMELPLKHADFRRAWDYTANSAGPDDPILGAYQTVLYILYESLGKASPQNLDGRLYKIPYLGREVYYVKEGSSGWNFESNRELTDAMASLCRYVPLEDGSKLWIVNIGWAPELKFISSNPFWLRSRERLYVLPGAAVYSLKATELKKLLAPVGPPAAPMHPPPSGKR